MPYRAVVDHTTVADAVHDYVEQLSLADLLALLEETPADAKTSVRARKRRSRRARSARAAQSQRSARRKLSFSPTKRRK